MPEKILGLDIKRDSLTAVLVKSELRGYRIMTCKQAPVLENEGLDNALKRLISAADLKWDQCLVSIPGEDVSYRNLRMPFKDIGKIRQAINFELETLLPFPIEDLLVDFTVESRPGQSQVLAASIKKALVSDYLSLLKALGLSPGVLDIRCVPIVSWILGQEGSPEHGLFLEIGETKSTMILFIRRRIALIRVLTFDRTGMDSALSVGSEVNRVDPLIMDQVESSIALFCNRVLDTLHAYKWQNNEQALPEKVFFTGTGSLFPFTGKLLNRFLGMPAEQIDLTSDKRFRMDEKTSRNWNPALMNGALSLAIREEKQGSGFNFRRDNFKASGHSFFHKKEVRRTAIAIVIALLMLALDAGADYFLVKKRQNILDKKITELYADTFPGTAKTLHPVHQMKSKIEQAEKLVRFPPGIGKKERVLDLLADISGRIPGSFDVLVTHTLINPESVLISGRTDNFNTVDAIKSALKGSLLFNSVNISSANLDRTGKGVRFEMRLRRNN